MLLPKTTDHILSVSHNDSDGVTCQILLGNVFNNITFVTSSFYELDKMVQNLEFDQYDTIIFTDIHPSHPESVELLKQQPPGKVILIDHHESFINMHDPSNGFIVVEGMCGAALVKKFLEHYYKADLSKYDQMIYIVNDYDMYTLKNPKSRCFHELLYGLYKIPQYRTEFVSGRTRFNKKELEFLRRIRAQFKTIWGSLDVFDLKTVKGCVIYSNEFMNELADKLMKEHGYRIVFVKHIRNGRVSVRHNIAGFKIGDLLKQLNFGGGHDKAAGMWVIDDMDLKNKVGVIEGVVGAYLKEHNVAN